MRTRLIGWRSLAMMGAIAIASCGVVGVKARQAHPIEQLTAKERPQGRMETAFAGRGDGETTCPVTGEQLTDRHLSLNHADRTVYFCCVGCLHRAQRSPETYIKPTLAEQRQAMAAVIESGESVNSAEFCDE